MAQIGKKLIVWGRYLATIAFFVVSAIYLYFNRSQLVVLTTLDILDVLLVAVLTFLYTILTGYTFTMLVNLVGVRLSWLETIALSLLTNFGNYLGPTRPGAALKAMYLKSARNVSYSQFSVIFAANLFLLFFVSGVIGLILLIILWQQTNVWPWLLVGICGGLIVISILPFVINFPEIQWQGRFWRLLNEANAGFIAIRSRGRNLLIICGLFIAQFILAAVVMVLAYQSFGQHISFTLALIIGVFVGISNIFTITPNNLGVQELIMAYLYTITGMDFSDGLVGAGLMRAVHILITFGLAPLFVYFMLKSANLSLSSILPGKKTPSAVHNIND